MFRALFVGYISAIRRMNERWRTLVNHQRLTSLPELLKEARSNRAIGSARAFQLLGRILEMINEKALRLQLAVQFWLRSRLRWLFS